MMNESAYFNAVAQVLETIETIIQEHKDALDDEFGFNDNPYFKQQTSTKLALWESIYQMTADHLHNRE